jgi:hypothetical protein
VQLAEIGGLRRPVVHLKVDVEVIVGIPWRAHAVVPEALQVCRQVARTAAGDEQIASELKIERVEIMIWPALLHSRESLVRGQAADLRCDRFAEPQIDTPKQALVIGRVIGEQRRIRFAGRIREIAVDATDVIVAAVTRARREDDGHRVCVFDPDAFGERVLLTAVSDDLGRGVEGCRRGKERATDGAPPAGGQVLGLRTGLPLTKPPLMFPIVPSTA